jgi:hypothetical protein
MARFSNGILEARTLELLKKITASGSINFGRS